jgi:type I restriction-modification system DNA methylase subunit
MGHRDDDGIPQGLTRWLTTRIGQMMTKEAQRAELHRTIWKIANDMRGSVDGWNFKSYVLGTLFYRFISDKLTAHLNQQERQAGDPTFDFATLIDADAKIARIVTRQTELRTAIDAIVADLEGVA